MKKRRTRSGIALVVVGALGAVAAACTPKGNLAGEPLKATSTAEAFEGVQCSAVRPQTEPDLMAWDPGSRANLNRLRRRGIVAVRYQAKGCNVELELLSSCIGTTATYEFSPYSANETKVARNASELFATLPLGAARLSGKVKGGRVLRTDYMLAGQYALPPDAVFQRADLRGTDCARATHVVSALYVGAFSMAAGEQRTMEGRASVFGLGAGGAAEAAVEVLGDEGDAEACRASQKEAKEDERCSVPLRVGLAPLDAPEAVASRVTSAEPAPGTMVRIPAGTFLMGSDDGHANEKPVHRVAVKAFEMDVTEVTVAEYRACVAEGGCPPASMVDAFCNWGQDDKADHPINCVSWDEADAYCRWANKRLPTEEEWEYAARGTDGRIFPWGNDAPGTQVCWIHRENMKIGTCAVGSFPSRRSPFGLLDMAGNVIEWTASPYSDDYSIARSDAARVCRGGKANDGSSESLRATRRLKAEPSFRHRLFGFRCAR